MRSAIRTGLGAALLASVVVTQPTHPALAGDLPPFEMSARPDVVEPGETSTVELLFASEVKAEDLIGLLIATNIGGGFDPVEPIDFNVDGRRVIARFDFPTWGTWEVVAFPEAVDRAALLGAGYPDRVEIDVRRATPGWVLLLVLGSLALVLTALTLAAVGGSRSRQRTAPWDETRKPGNPLSREPI